jgi:hypothetical protein
VSARLADYVLHARPVSDDDHVFLRGTASHTRLAGHASIYRVTATTFRTAGVTDVKVGTSLKRPGFRAHLSLCVRPGWPWWS